VLTNAEGGRQLVNELTTDDWALRRFAGVSNLPAVPRALSPDELAPYEGRYVHQVITADGAVVNALVELRGGQGQLHMTEMLELPSRDLSPTDPAPTVKESRLAFYRDDFVLVLDATGQPVGSRADFVRDADGGVAWLRQGGRLYQHVG
jgi:hypothetical protein